jgi:hypothetical protein
MYNNRPIDDPRLAQALQEVAAVYRKYDLAGAAMLVNEHEAAFVYPLYTTWNAIIEDDTQPMGIRIRIKTDEQGTERAQALGEGTAHLFCQLKDFGAQTQLWMQDFLRLLKQSGMRIYHVPFNGQKLPRIKGLNLNS